MSKPEVSYLSFLKSVAFEQVTFHLWASDFLRFQNKGFGLDC